MRSADSTRFMRVMADERGMMVGARETRLENKVGVRPPSEKGVEDLARSAAWLSPRS